MWNVFQKEKLIRRLAGEFGCKVSVATSSRDNWVVGIQALHNNPYDGHTLVTVLDQIRRLTGWKPKDAYCDRGYRGHEYPGETVPPRRDGSRTKKTLPLGTEVVPMHRDSAVEPKISHIKYDNRMDRNYLTCQPSRSRMEGKEGDRINALLAGSGANLRKLLIAFSLSLFVLVEKWKNLARIYWHGGDLLQPTPNLAS